MSPMLLFLSPHCSDEVTDVLKTLWPDQKKLTLFKSLKMLLLLIDHDREVCGNKLVASVHKLENVSPLRLVIVINGHVC